VLAHITEEDMGEIEPKELVDYLMEEYGTNKTLSGRFKFRAP